MIPSERRKVFVTGGAGFIARAIYRRAAQEDWPWEFTCYSRSDEKHRALNQQYPQVGIVRGDITTPDIQHLAAAMRGHDIVIHAAATKYVDRSEMAALDTIRINTLGSMNVMEAAFLAGVQSLVGISTDKACSPVSIYGASKMAMERAFQDYAQLTGAPQISLVRYGNVIGSTGSVIPLFRRQAQEGTITLTNPEMTRFWLTIEDAVDLIWAALKEPEGGTILIPRCRSLTMAGVATACAILEVGAELECEVARTIIGQRFGEKVHEELLTSVEMVYTDQTFGYLGEGDLWIMRLHPVTSAMQRFHMSEAYSSDAPDTPLSTEEMMDWIERAPAG
ncbi:hypothetical protein LCGC14_1431110 [marine sediment metagenome]|uniref:Polysaccharide biosynthesis protein CapD-like domain-containing protein n=1 Tax=marine sediment metagenome TaxID=412755 RepID=A0A0F9JNY3_9ZZZZ